MMDLPLAHIAGIPVEETIGSFGPALLIALGAAMATLRLRRMPSRGRTRGSPGTRHGRD
jgi:hypothetical protein